jgi:hypothetical protein
LKSIILEQRSIVRKEADPLIPITEEKIGSYEKPLANSENNREWNLIMSHCNTSA